MTTVPGRNSFGKRTCAVLACTLLGVVAGCKPAVVGFERFNPPPGPAREALAGVLEAWRSGRAPEEGVGPNRDVHVVDKQRKAGQRLQGFDILGEVNVEKGRGFAVRLTLQDPEESPVVRFLVIGENPLWVWRQEDFEMISHWMHPMDDDRDQGKQGTDLSPKTP